MAALAIASVAVGSSAAEPHVQPQVARWLDHRGRVVDGGAVHDRGGRAVLASGCVEGEGNRRDLGHRRRVPALLQGRDRSVGCVSADEELRGAACKTDNIGSWRAFTVANDALTVVVNQQNTWATCLTVAELKKIWEPGSKVDNWRDVRASFPDVPMKLFGAGTDSGTFEYFTEAINGRARASRTDYQASEDDNVLVQGVAGERGGMGYFGYSYYTENRSRLNAVQVRNPKTDQCVTPNVASVHNTPTSRSPVRCSSTRRDRPSSARKCRRSSTTSSTTS